MKKTASILVAVALVAAVAYGIYQWAFDGYAPSPKDMIKRQLTKLIGDVEVKVSKANKTVAEFGEAVGQLKTHCLRTGQHVQTLADKETQARQKVETVESELRLIKGKIEAKQPVQYNDGSTLHPEEVEARVSARGEELAASRECLQIIVSDRESFEKLHEEQLKQLRMAPIHQETLRTRLSTLQQKLDMYRDRQVRLDDVGAGQDAYTALLADAKRAIGEADIALSGSVGVVESGFKPLLQESSGEKVDASAAASDRALNRINELLVKK